LTTSFVNKGFEALAALEGSIAIVYEGDDAHMYFVNSASIEQPPFELAHFANVSNFTADNFMTQAVLPG
jgi:hypothetical protein